MLICNNAEEKINYQSLIDHPILSSSRTVGTAMLVVLFLLSFASPVALVPPRNAHPVPCRHCCDHLEPAEGSAAPPPTGVFTREPEIRTYINMTILKGTTSTALGCVRLQANWMHPISLLIEVDDQPFAV